MGAMSRPALLAVLVAAVASVATAAIAADMPVPSGPVYKAPAAYQPALYNWTGFYFGGIGGVNYADDTFTDTTTTGFQTAGTNAHVGYAGLIGGAQVGADYEFTPFVIGVQGSYLASNLTASTVIPSVGTGLNQRSAVTGRWYATATGRIGYAIDTILVYAKGGAAWAREDYTESVLSAVNLEQSQENVAGHRTGFTVGAGFEYGLTEHISALVEYDFLDFGTKNYGFGALSFTPAATGATTPLALPINITSNIHELMGGINFRFD
jgi:outer membrane immunogenic protein